MMWLDVCACVSAEKVNKILWDENRVNTKMSSLFDEKGICGGTIQYNVVGVG